MIITTLKEIKKNVLKDRDKKEKILKEYEKYLATKNLKKGRVRPRDPVEAEILAKLAKK